MNPANRFTVRHYAPVTREKRQVLNQHNAVLIWFTGLSGAGKSTLAHAVELYLHEAGCRTMVLDGDNVRQGLCKDLGFSEADRRENIRRVAEVAKLLLDAGVITLTALISPFISERQFAKQLYLPDDFIEIYCHCDLEVCEQRDVKGLYRKARSGEISDFTGISSPYEPPENPDLILETGRDSLAACVEQVLDLLKQRRILVM
jgi:adenylylsulfate kinase